MSLAERLKRTSFSRVNSVALLKHQDIVLKCLDELDVEYSDKVQRCKEIWKQGLCLLAVASSPKSHVTEERWKQCAQIFAKNIQELNVLKVTSYLHCFVYHLGYYLEKYGTIERLANYSIEGNIKWIKDALKSSSNHFGGKEGMNLCWSQLLQKHYRSQDSFKKSLPQHDHAKQWTNTLESELTLASTFE